MTNGDKHKTMIVTIQKACADAFGVPSAVAFCGGRASRRHAAGMARLAALYLLDTHLRYASTELVAEVLAVYPQTVSRMRTRTRAMLSSNSNALFKTGLAKAMRTMSNSGLVPANA